MIESPKEAFNKIILSEKKNYLTLLIFFISLRFLIISRFISVPYSGDKIHFDLLTSILYFIFTTGLLILIFSFILKFSFKVFKLNSRLIDIYSTVTYSFIPQVFAIIFIFPVEVTVYGELLFSNNPYPYSVKEGVFYVLVGFEILTVIWSVFLMIKAISSFKLSIIKSIVITLILNSLTVLYLTISSKIIFQNEL
ncbi:MAG: YIP1 family protein [Ignavibacterium sp.]|nr:YIP1 family protein [Ignavibacterium sp.]